MEEKKSLGFAEGMMVGISKRCSDSEGKMKMFDWDKAARIIRERDAQNASAGLQGDWDCTSGEILRDGKPVPKEETYTYLSSFWCLPYLEIDQDFLPCYKDGEDPHEYWPDSALAILNEKEEE